MNCATLFVGDRITEPRDATGCLLPSGHDGPHLFRSEDGKHYALETDWGCTCDHCMECDGDYRTIFWETTEPIAAGIAVEGDGLGCAVVVGCEPSNGEKK